MARERASDEIADEVRQRIGGDEQRVLSINTGFSALTYKHVLLPVWMLAYRYGDDVYRVVVNARTGEVNGERPYSIPKIVAAVLAVLGLIWWWAARS